MKSNINLMVGAALLLCLVTILSAWFLLARQESETDMRTEMQMPSRASLNLSRSPAGFDSLPRRDVLPPRN